MLFKLNRQHFFAASACGRCDHCWVVVTKYATVRHELGGRQLEASAPAKVKSDYGKLPLSFEVKQGQTDSKVKFPTRGSGYALVSNQFGEQCLTVLRRTNLLCLPSLKAKVELQPGEVKRCGWIRGRLIPRPGANDCGSAFLTIRRKS